MTAVFPLNFMCILLLHRQDVADLLACAFTHFQTNRSSMRGRLRLCEFHLLCEIGVKHPRRKKSGQSPVLETLRNDRVACLRFRRAECDVDGFAQTLRGEAISTCFVDDPLLEV